MIRIERIKKSRKDRVCSICYSTLYKNKSYIRRIERIREEDGDYFDHLYLCCDCFNYLEDKDYIDI